MLGTSLPAMSTVSGLHVTPFGPAPVRLTGPLPNAPVMEYVPSLAVVAVSTLPLFQLAVTVTPPSPRHPRP